VLLDIATADPTWSARSSRELASAADRGPLVINPIIYAEVSTRFSRLEDLDAALPVEEYVRAPLPYSAAFLAEKCFLDYRRRGGRRSSPLPEFFIGAHAAVARMRLLTRDPARYRTSFPGLELVAPAG